MIITNISDAKASLSHLIEVVQESKRTYYWTIAVDIELSIYSDRLEIISPGKLQNSMTIEKMIAGQRSPRNPLIMDILRDYAYVDARGMGVRTKIIPLMKKFNSSEPEFKLTDDYLKTTLFKKVHV